MAYQIHYGPVKHRVGPKNGGRAVVVLVFLLALLVGFTYRREIREILIPGDSEVTAAALDNAVRNLREGDTFSDVFACFCQEIMDGAEIPQ